MSDFDDSAKEENEEQTVAVEYDTLAHGLLSPRHRKLAQLAAGGLSNADICKELGYSPSRVSILLKNPYVSREVARLQDRIFEETIQARLKGFVEPAMNNIHNILTDTTNRVKVSEKMEMSKWVVEKLDGKAIQKHDIGENLLGVFLDRLDARRLNPAQEQERQVLDVSASPTLALAESPPPVEEEKAKTPPISDELADWVRDFCGESVKINGT